MPCPVHWLRHQCGVRPSAIKIGGLIPVTGLGLAPNLAALKASARDVNAHGGIHGRRVEIDECDDRNNPNNAEACARQMVRDGVVATAGTVTTFGELEAPVLDAAGTPR